MKLLRPLLALALLLILIVAVWLWWSLPSKVDMSNYAPADSIVYVEFNNLEGVARAIQHSEAWQAAAAITQAKPAPQNRFVRTAARAGIGPLPAVLFARSQVALVVLNLNTSAENDTLKKKPEFALIAETHTARWRIKPAAVESVKSLAGFVYGASMCSERSADADYIECSVAGAERKIVGAVEGSLVVIGNSDNAVRSCLEVRRGNRPSLKTDPELQRVRASVASENTLGFGYISSANSEKLFSWASPLLVSQAPGEQEVGQLIAVIAGKVLHGIAWTANSARGGIEDRFLFLMEPAVVSRLQPAFEIAERDDDFWRMVPDGFRSLTIYRNKAPATALSSLNSAVALKVDALPAVLFGTLLRSSLSVYGISDPKETLTTLSPPLLTVRPSQNEEGSILVARVIDEPKLRQLLTAEVFKGTKGEIFAGLDANPNPEREFAAVFANGYVLLGRTENMRAGLTALRQNAATEKKDLQTSVEESSAPIVTFANDEARINTFISTLLKLQGRRLSSDEVVKLQATLRSAGFSSTETRLNSFGIERTTHSAFGQFSTFVSFLQPDGGPTR
jgi:hypothetical protein